MSSSIFNILLNFMIDETNITNINIGSLVTVIKNTYGLSATFLENAPPDATIYPWHNSLIQKGMVGLVLSEVNEDSLFVKTLWTVNEESLILYVRIRELKIFDCDQ